MSVNSASILRQTVGILRAVLRVLAIGGGLAAAYLVWDTRHWLLPSGGQLPFSEGFMVASFTACIFSHSEGGWLSRAPPGLQDPSSPNRRLPWVPPVFSAFVAFFLVMMAAQVPRVGLKPVILGALSGMGVCVVYFAACGACIFLDRQLQRMLTTSRSQVAT